MYKVAVPGDVCTFIFCSQVAWLPGQAGEAASSKAYKKPKVPKMTGITDFAALYAPLVLLYHKMPLQILSIV